MSLRLADVRWSVAGATILDGVTAEAPGGRLTGLLGPNGAGKSTLLRVVAGVLAPDAGAATLDGADLLAVPRRERARRVALVEQEATAVVPLTVREAVEVGRTPHLSRWGGLADRDRRAVDDALAAAGVAGLADRALGTLSGGERQRAHLARALAQEPRLLLLDEPTNHLDVHARLELLALLRRLTAARNGHLDDPAPVDGEGPVLPGAVVVRVDPRYYRPTDVESLLGDSTKARERLGWRPVVAFEDLVVEMVQEDLAVARRDELLKRRGFPIKNPRE